MKPEKLVATKEQFVMLPRNLVRSDAWRSASINARRFIDFLMMEHMAHGGAENGKLKAPYRQLEHFSIGARYIADAIREAEELGLVHVQRQGLKVATLYALTWLETADKKPATNKWDKYHNPRLAKLPERKVKNLPYKGKAELPYKGKADSENYPTKGRQIQPFQPQNLPYKGKALYRSSYQAEITSTISEQGCGPDGDA